MIDHVTYQVPKGKINYPVVTDFFKALEFEEVEPDEAIEKDWTVRWFAPADYSPGCAIIHLVEPKQVAMSDNSDGEVELQLGHFCCTVSPGRYEELQSPGSVTHHLLEAATPGSTRIWVRGPFGLRAEVRSEERALEVVDLEAERAEEGTTYESPYQGERSFHKRAVPNPNVPRLAERLAKALSDPLDIHAEVLNEAFDIYRKRNVLYQDNWKRMGLKGMAFRVRERAERAWDNIFNRGAEAYVFGEVDTEALRDDMLDMINFAVFMVRAIDDDNLNGSWFDMMGDSK